MPDPLAGTAQVDVSASAPVAPETEIEKIITARIDERIKGFQKLVSAREEEASALRRELEETRLAGLPEDERETLLEQKKDRRIQELEAQIELNRLATDYGDEVPFFQSLLGAESAEDQLKVLRAYADVRLAKANPSPAIVVKDEIVVPEVDLNRPLRPTRMGGQQLPDGSFMTEADADRILGANSGSVASVTQHRLRPTD